MFATGNDGVRLLLVQQYEYFISVIAAIGQDVLALDVKGLQDLISCHTIVDVARCDFVSERVAEGVHNRVNLGG